MLRLKCTKFDFGWGSAQTPLAELTTLTSINPLHMHWQLHNPSKCRIILWNSVKEGVL